MYPNRSQIWLTEWAKFKQFSSFLCGDFSKESKRLIFYLCVRDERTNKIRFTKILIFSSPSLSLSLSFFSFPISSVVKRLEIYIRCWLTYCSRDQNLKSKSLTGIFPFLIQATMLSFFPFQFSLAGLSTLRSSETRFDEIPPLWQNFMSLGQFVEG